MYTTNHSRGLRGAEEFTAMPMPIAEGEALITAQSNVSPSLTSMSALELQRGGEILLSSDRTVGPADVMAASAMQTVRPESSAECPPCPPPSVIYRDRVVYRDRKVPCPPPPPPRIVYRDRYLPGKTVTVPGPTQYVTVPGGSSGASSPGGLPTGFATYDEWWNALGRDAGIPYDPAGASGFSPGGVVPMSPERADVAGGFPWWLLVVGAAVMWYAGKERRS